MNKELFTYYNLSECSDTRNVIDELEDFSTDLKIDYSYDSLNEVVKVIDLDLSEDEVNYLIEFFDNHKAIVDFDYQDIYGDDDDLEDYFNQEYDY